MFPLKGRTKALNNLSYLGAKLSAAERIATGANLAMNNPFFLEAKLSAERIATETIQR